MLTVTLLAQNDVTTFLGIPVDGSKSEFIQKLKAKGFRLDPQYEILTGIFNGQESMISIKENNGLVCRVAVTQKTVRDETQVRLAFNKLTEQFNQNNRYVASDNNNYLNDREQIGFGIRLHHKQYENHFFQKNKDDGKPDFNKNVWILISSPEYEEYLLTIIYDNEYNMPNGNDL